MVALSVGRDLYFVLTNPSGKYVTTEGVAPPPSAHRGQKISERINQFLEVFVCCPGLGVMLAISKCDIFIFSSCRSEAYNSSTRTYM